jgi:hypothetical protein
VITPIALILVFVLPVAARARSAGNGPCHARWAAEPLGRWPAVASPSALVTVVGCVALG